MKNVVVNMNKRKIRALMRLLSSVLFGVLYIPHIIMGWNSQLVRSDLKKLEYQIELSLPVIFQLLCQDSCHTDAIEFTFFAI